MSSASAPMNPTLRRRPLTHRLSDENSYDRIQFSTPGTHVTRTAPSLHAAVRNPSRAPASPRRSPARTPVPSSPSPAPSPRQRAFQTPSPTPSVSRQRSTLIPLHEWMTPAVVAAGYVIVHVVNEGSFGTVLKGRRVADQRWVAVKVVRKSDLSDRERSAVRKQAITLRALRHRYIAQIYDDFEDDDFFYHIFEYLHGGDLYDRLEARGKPFSEPQVLFLARQLFYAVTYLHSKRAAHRDIKLENFVFETLPSDRRQVMKLIDFDLLVVRSAAAPPIELCNDMCGTILYVSPEIASAREHVPEQSDMWACGVMLYVLLSYHMPFQGSSGRQILRAVRTADPHFSPSVWSSVSAETRQLVRDLLNKNGAARPSAAEALERVKEIQDMSRDAAQSGSKLRALKRGFRSVSLNIWDPSGRLARRSREIPDARKGSPEGGVGSSRISRQSASNFPGEEPSSASSSLRSSFILHSEANSEAESVPTLADATLRSDHYFGQNSSLALSNHYMRNGESAPNSMGLLTDFPNVQAIGGVLGHKRVANGGRMKTDISPVQAPSPLRSSRRLRKQGWFAFRIRNWIHYGGGDHARR